MMWILLARDPIPDAPYWWGRRSLAFLDAIAWPIALGIALTAAPFSKGIVLPVAGTILALNAIARAHTAVSANQRYRFTTWRFGKIVAVLLLVGLALKLGVAWR